MTAAVDAVSHGRLPSLLAVLVIAALSALAWAAVLVVAMTIVAMFRAWVG